MTTIDDNDNDNSYDNDDDNDERHLTISHYSVNVLRKGKMCHFQNSATTESFREYVDECDNLVEKSSSNDDKQRQQSTTMLTIMAMTTMTTTMNGI